MPRATFDRVFSAAHRVHNDPGKCRNVHGHNYRVRVDIASEDLDPQGFVLPLDVVKAVVDRFDHVLIIDQRDPFRDIFASLPLDVALVPFVPSTENLAADIAERLVAAAAMRGRSVTVELELRETDSILAYASAAP